MADPDPEPDLDSEAPGMPRWVKVVGALLVVFILLVAVAVAFGGGQHGPGRHSPATDAPGDDRDPDDAILRTAVPAAPGPAEHAGERPSW